MRIVLQKIRIFILSFIVYACTDPGSGSKLIPSVGKDSVDTDLNNMRHYLIHQASAISDRPVNIATPGQWESIRPQRYREFLEMMGIDHVNKANTDKLRVTITGSIQKDGYRIEKLYFESLPGLYVRANLYIPDRITSPRPAILYVSGHTPDQKFTYQAHPAKFAKLGFVCLLTETIQFGEVRGEHWGPVRNGWFNWYSRGYNPGGVELWNAMRAIDVLCARKEVDSTRIGVTGISGGGSQSWYIAAADPRIKAAAPVCGAGTLKDHLLHRTIDGHCDCMMPNNIYLQDYKDIGALIAPRPLLIAQSDQDGMYRIEAVKELAEQVKTIYKLYKKENSLKIVTTPGPHSYHRISRQQVFAFFLEHLMNKNITPEEAGDIDTSAADRSSPEELKIYVNGMPAEDRTTTIQHSFIPRAGFPSVQSKKTWDSLKVAIVQFLREKTFRAFPKDSIAFDPKVEFTSMSSEHEGNIIYSLNTEDSWRLKVDLQWRNDPRIRRPLIVVLRNYDEERWASEEYASNLDTANNIAFVELRGIGETGWEPSLQWHLRRAAAWTGRTIASMQVYDLMRFLVFLRSLPNVSPDQIAIAAQREMGAVALYAALLDGRCSRVFLKDPPATQDVTSPVDGKDVPMEMLNCLQVTDVNQLPALILPTQTIFFGKVPVKYTWSQEMIKRFR